MPASSFDALKVPVASAAAVPNDAPVPSLTKGVLEMPPEEAPVSLSFDHAGDEGSDY
jgi:hypothetical protein